MKLPLMLFISLFVAGCNGHKSLPVDKGQNNSTLSDSAIFGNYRNTEVDSETVTGESEDGPEALDDANLEKIEVSKKDGKMWITGNIRMDYRIIGYAQPDTSSKKMVLLSVFTKDVEGNPHECPYGSFYDSHGMSNSGLDLIYIGDEGQFIKANVTEQNSLKGSESIRGLVYIEKKWVEFD